MVASAAMVRTTLRPSTASRRMMRGWVVMVWNVVLQIRSGMWL
jgi:hypothetical protein